MSERNGDRARFHKDHKRKVRRRQRLQRFVRALRAGTSGSVDARREGDAETARADTAQGTTHGTPQRGIVPDKKKTANHGTARKKDGSANETRSTP